VGIASTLCCCVQGWNGPGTDQFHPPRELDDWFAPSCLTAESRRYTAGIKINHCRSRSERKYVPELLYPTLHLFKVLSGRPRDSRHILHHGPSDRRPRPPRRSSRAAVRLSEAGRDYGAYTWVGGAGLTALPAEFPAPTLGVEAPFAGRILRSSHSPCISGNRERSRSRFKSCIGSRCNRTHRFLLHRAFDRSCRRCARSSMTEEDPDVAGVLL